MKVLLKFLHCSHFKNSSIPSHYERVAVQLKEELKISLIDTKFQHCFNCKCTEQYPGHIWQAFKRGKNTMTGCTYMHDKHTSFSWLEARYNVLSVPLGTCYFSNLLFLPSIRIRSTQYSNMKRRLTHWTNKYIDHWLFHWMGNAWLKVMIMHYCHYPAIC